MSIDAQEGLLVAGRGCIFKDEVVLKGYPPLRLSFTRGGDRYLTNHRQPAGGSP